MTERGYQTSIKSYRARMSNARKQAVKFTEDGNLDKAIEFLITAKTYKAVIDELEFQEEMRGYGMA